MRAVFRYPGSKWGIAKWIVDHFPEGYEKMVYLEPFIGSGAVFFNKKPGTVETINDLDSDIVNLFRVLREKPAELKRALELTPYSREEYDLAFEHTEDPMEKARRFMVKTTQAIGAKLNTKCGWRNHKQLKIGGTACKWAGITETIDEATARLRGGTTNLVQIEGFDIPHKDLLMEHLNGKKQIELAAERGVTRQCISRQIADAKKALAAELRRMGFAAQ